MAFKDGNVLWYNFLVLIPLFFQRPAGLVGWMQYLVSVFFQGVALPVLGYTTQKSSVLLDKAIKRIDYNTLKTEQIAERIEHMVNIIEKNEEKEHQEIEKIQYKSSLKKNK